MKWKILFIPFLLVITIIICACNASADVTFYDTTTFQINGNVNISFPSTGLTIESYNHAGSWLQIDDIDFNITSSNPINITLYSINSQTSVRFKATTTSGLVYFNISGLNASTNYNVFRDNVLRHTLTSNASGGISFSYNAWSEHEFEITQADRQIKVTYTYTAMQNTVDWDGIIIVAAIIMCLFVTFMFLMALRNGSVSPMMFGLIIVMVVAVVALFVVLQVGTFMNDTISEGFDVTETFNVESTGTDQVFTLRHYPVPPITVEYNTGYGFGKISSSYYRLSDNILTVFSTGLT